MGHTSIYSGLCFLAAEYAVPVWASSAHAKTVDVALNETARIVTGCLNPTSVEMMYPLLGIAPPCITRKVAAAKEKAKQEKDPVVHCINTSQPNKD
nr:unnamed protein product [Callosobruchus analis]